MTRIPEWLGQRARVTPGRLALMAGPDRLTFAELDRAVDERAASLAALGIAPGDRVALLLRNGRAFVELIHAVTRMGAILVPLNVRLTPGELAFQLADSRARLLVHDDAHAAKASTAAAGLPHLARASLPLMPATPRMSTAESIDLDVPHTIVYTSGTTGRPKGALLTWGNHWWSAVGSALNLGLRESDRWLIILPLFHVGGLAIVLRSAIYGITAIVHEGFDAASANRAIDADGVTIVSVVSTALQRMLDERGDRPYPASFRCALLGGGPAPRPLLELATSRGAPVVQTYGLTETASQVATLAPEDALRRLGSAGKPLMPTELRIILNAATAYTREVGEIVVRGPTVTPGYVDRPEATAAAIRDGWLHTGDLGYLDEEGYLYVVDRRDDLIVTGGENVYPAEVEAVLLDHPAVREAGVIGLPDKQWGQRVVAIVVAEPGTRGETLAAFCRERLAGYKVPRELRFVAELPRNAAGKLLRRQLRE